MASPSRTGIVGTRRNLKGPGPFILAGHAQSPPPARADRPVRLARRGRRRRRGARALPAGDRADPRARGAASQPVGAHRAAGGRRARVGRAHAVGRRRAVGRLVRYGPRRAQVVEVDGDEDGPVCILVHGGFWRARYTRLLMRPLARHLAARGWLTANVEYRRL